LGQATSVNKNESNFIFRVKAQAAKGTNATISYSSQHSLHPFRASG